MINLSTFVFELSCFLEYNVIDGTLDLVGRQKANGQLTFGLAQEGRCPAMETVICSASNLYELLVKPGIVNPEEEISDAQSREAAKIIKEWALLQK